MTNLVLYRKYRPLTFADVSSQEHVKTTLTNAVVNNRAGHAYLFTGPRGVGKTTIARIFARAINCKNRQNGEPCNTCDICKSFLNGSSLDIMEIDAASHTGVDNVRELTENLKFAPTSADFKVVIVDEVHMLSKGAFNALLKTLEEPPKHAVFVLATTEVHKVPATIISRTQRFDFKKASLAELIARMKFVCNDNQIKITDGALAMVAQAADGSFRDSLSLLDQVINYSDGNVDEQLVERVLGLIGTQTISKFLQLLIENKATEGVRFVSKLMYDGVDLYQFQKDFLEYLRKLLLAKLGNIQQEELTPDLQTQLTFQAQAVELTWLVKTIEVFQKAGNELKWAIIQSLPLELAVVEVTNFTGTQKAVNHTSTIDQKSEPPAETKETETPVLTVDSPNDSEAFDKIISSWSPIMEKLKEYNHSLISSLKLATPTQVIGKELILLFPYKFHKDAIDARKNRIVVDQVIEEVTGLKLMVKPLLQKEWKGELPKEEEPEAKSSMLESALKIMGGEVE